MKSICIMPVRNEEWVLGFSARAVLMWVDELIILDHASTDATGEICRGLWREYPQRVTVVGDDNPEWQEMRHRQALLELARASGASHIVTVDADEVLSANLLPLARGVIAGCQPHRILQFPWLAMRGSTYSYHRSGVWASQFVSTAFLDLPEYHWKARAGYDFHHRHPMGGGVQGQMLPMRPIGFGGGGLMHLQFTNDRRLRAKQALYKMTEVIRWPGRSTVQEIDRMYNLAVYGDYTPSPKPRHDLAVAPTDWWSAYEHLSKYLDLGDSKPWQEIECEALIAQHGAETFIGLDLFGVV